MGNIHEIYSFRFVLYVLYIHVHVLYIVQSTESQFFWGGKKKNEKKIGTMDQHVFFLSFLSLHACCGGRSGAERRGEERRGEERRGEEMRGGEVSRIKEGKKKTVDCGFISEVRIYVCIYVCM